MCINVFLFTDASAAAPPGHVQAGTRKLQGASGPWGDLSERLAALFPECPVREVPVRSSDAVAVDGAWGKYAAQLGIDAGSFIIGHGVGVVPAVRIAEATPVLGLVLVGNSSASRHFATRSGDDATSPLTIAWKRVEHHAEYLTIFADDTDAAIPIAAARKFFDPSSPFVRCTASFFPAPASDRAIATPLAEHVASVLAMPNSFNSGSPISLTQLMPYASVCVSG